VNDFLGLLGNWHFWVLVAGYWFFTASIGALPMPDTTSSEFYGWFFKMANTFAANLSRAAAGKIPGTDDAMPLPGAQAKVTQQAQAAKVANRD